MPTKDQTLTALEHYFAAIQAQRLEESQLRRESFLDEDGYEDRKREIGDRIRQDRQRMIGILEQLERMPERHHMRHWNALVDFHKNGAFVDSVFVMTKFPDPTDPHGVELQAVIEAVLAGIAARGYKPRIANQQNYQRWLWDNVELYLLGCHRGIAIVEDRYAPELNPNVAMEWGWMYALGRDVLFLREKEFEHERADWTGLISESFDWLDPKPGVDAALARFLPQRA
jgi:hypothetical protein